MAFFEAKTRNSPIAAKSSSEKSERSPEVEYFISVTSAVLTLNFAHFREDSSRATKALPRRFRRHADTPTRRHADTPTRRCWGQESKDGRAGLAEMRDIDQSTSDCPRLCFDGA
jgi:hypothetical protein